MADWLTYMSQDLSLLKSEVVEGARPTLKQLDEVRGKQFPTHLAVLMPIFETR